MLLRFAAPIKKRTRLCYKNMSLRATARLRPTCLLPMLSFLLFSRTHLKFVEGNAHSIGYAHSTRDRRYRHGLDNVDSVFVIDLASRNDRLHEISAVLSSLGVSNQAVIKGVPHSCGALGCSLSNAMAVAECMDSNAVTERFLLF